MSRSITIEKIALAGPKDKHMQRRVLVVEVNYQEGGLSYWDYKHHPRGYWLSVRPQDEDDRGTTSWMIGDGVKAILVDAKRFDAKKLPQVAATAKTHALYAGLLLRAAREETFTDRDRLTELLAQAQATREGIVAV